MNPIQFLLVALPLLTPLPTAAVGTPASPVTSIDPPSSAVSVSPAQFVSAADEHFLYEGRFDLSNPAAPVAIWQGSRIRLDFDGDTLALRFDDVRNQNFFDVEIDGHTSITELRADTPPIGVKFSGLGEGRHRLVLFKRSEAAAGTACFRGVELAADAHAFAATRPAYKLAMQFFGDSITAGACNEDGATDQWEDRKTHNNALSYGAMTAAAFSADYRNVAVSGMGVAIGWVEMKAGEIWDRVYPHPSSARADLTKWTPQLIFVNLGENDDSFTTAKHLPFPTAAFSDGYVALVQAIRQAYPAAEIVILRGGMFGGAQSDRLRLAWEPAVARLEAGDPHIAHFVFKHWSSTHPRVADHRAMADELIAWLRQQEFMKSHL